MSHKKHRRERGHNAPDAASFEARTTHESTIFTGESDVHHRQGHRHPRLQQIVRDELGGLLRDEVRDPALAGLEVTSVELSIDYRNARVHVRVPDGADLRRVSLALERATPFFRAQLTDALDLKFVPSLRFLPARSADPEEAP